MSQFEIAGRADTLVSDPHLLIYLAGKPYDADEHAALHAAHERIQKAGNHVHALAVYFTFYNFARVHKTLRHSLAMVAGLSKALWSMENVVALIDAQAEP